MIQRKLKGWAARGTIAAIALGASTACTAASKMTESERTIVIGLIPKETLIVYEANAPTTHVTIFTDCECPPCSKFHEWVPKFTSYGVEVRYAGTPRKEPYPEMISIWCASDRRDAMDRAKRGERVESTPRDHPLAMHKSVAKGVGVKAIPTLVTEQGKLVRGLKPIRRWIDAVARAVEQDRTQATSQPNPANTVRRDLSSTHGR